MRLKPAIDATVPLPVPFSATRAPTICSPGGYDALYSLSKIITARLSNYYCYACAAGMEI
jgi:hypothetical protein